jgi:hypothetical protein
MDGWPGWKLGDVDLKRGSLLFCCLNLVPEPFQYRSFVDNLLHLIIAPYLSRGGPFASGCGIYNEGGVIMRRNFFLGTLAAVSLLLSSCSLFKGEAKEPTVKTTEPVATEEPAEPQGPSPEEIAAWRAQSVEAGMTRTAVEEKLGEPAHLSRTKEGELYIMYEMGDNWRSVVYDNSGKVVEVYP